MSDAPSDAVMRENVDACPACGLTVPSQDLLAQSEHMLRKHPEVVQQRRAESARWAGWVND